MAKRTLVILLSLAACDRGLLARQPGEDAVAADAGGGAAAGAGSGPGDPSQTPASPGGTGLPGAMPATPLIPKPQPLLPKGPPGCGLPAAAFCEDFETLSPGGRGGDLDERRIAFSRYGHTVTYFDRAGAWSQRPEERYEVQRNLPTLCGEVFENAIPGEDVRICPGTAVGGMTLSNQFNELFDDSGDFGVNSFMVRQPFDFSAGGTLTFDVDGKRAPYYEGHGWWFEVWITEDPAPIPYHTAPTIHAFPRNGLGILFSPMGRCLTKPLEDCNEVAAIFVTRDFEVLHSFHGQDKSFIARDREMNHFELRLSPERVEIWVSDAGSTQTRKLQSFDGLDLPFDAGYVHFQHSQYNAFKDARPGINNGVWASPAQVYRWDNIAFDGPVLPMLRAYDVPDNTETFDIEPYFHNSDIVKFGYDLRTQVTVSVDGVDPTGAVAAMINFNCGIASGRVLRYRLNGGAELSYTIPSYGDPELSMYDAIRSLSVPVPVASVVPGKNTITFSLSNAQGFETMLGNIDLTLVVP